MTDHVVGTTIAPAFLTRVEFASRVDAELVPFESGVYTICYLHISRLKRFNRIHGIEEGDRALFAVAKLLRAHAVNGLLGRYAGDGFIYVVKSEQSEELAASAAALLPVADDAPELVAKVGAVMCQRLLGAADCIERARFACETLSSQQDHGYYLFDQDLQETFDRRTYVVDHLDDAIAAGEIEAWAQPIVRVLTGKVCEVEALARWNSRRYGYLMPFEFVPQLERHALIHKLDLEVFRLTCEQWVQAQALGVNVPFGVNLSRLDFELCDIYASLRAIMQRYQVPVDQVHIEVTESTEARDDGSVTEGIRRFRQAGFSIYMDDFGTGYSSLGTIADLDFDVIKIDKSFIDRIETNKRARAVLADTVSMVKRLGMQTLCEGIETNEQFRFLLSIGCEKAQGYLFSRPISHDQVMKALRSQAASHESLNDDAYYDAIGQINLLDGTSVATHGIEAATVYGRNPIALLEFTQDDIRMLTCNLAYERLLERMGYQSFDDFVTYISKGSGRIRIAATDAARRARESGSEQQFDFIVGNTYCSVAIKFVAHVGDRGAFINLVTSVDNAPQITEHTLLTGILAIPDRKYFWKDNDRRFLGANQAFLDYYGFPSLESILGKNDEDMGWHVDNDPFRNDELRVLGGETIFDAQGVCESHGEYRRIVANKRPLYSNGAIVGLVGYFEDVGPYTG